MTTIKPLNPLNGYHHANDFARCISAEAVARRLGGGKARRSGEDWITCCPAHDDKNPSLSLRDGENGELRVHCYAECSQLAVIAALKRKGISVGRQANDSADGDRRGNVAALERKGFLIAATYDYCDQSGALLYQNVRLERRSRSGERIEKTFRQRRPNPNRPGWIENLNGVDRVPFHLPELLRRAGEDVHITEGEKDADSMARLGLLSTSITAPALTDLEFLRGRHVCIHEDNDEAGRSKVKTLAAKLLDVADSVRIVRYPDAGPGGDVTDWLNQGRGLEKLLERIEQAEAFEDAPKIEPLISEPQSDVSAWPILESTAAFGIVGEIAELATRDSEADPTAVTATTLAWGAAMFGRNRFMSVGDTPHHSRHFCALVGASSRARKGTSLDPVRRIFKATERALQSQSTLAFPSGLSLQLSQGPLSSGEGLLNAIRDKRDDEDTGGVEDKRLLCIEGEFGAVLRACQRQGNTLSSTLRVGWDGWTLEPLTKHDKICATDPHICVVGHITGHELKELLTTSDLWNGFANRFMWIAVRRRASIPFPKAMPNDDVERIGRELARVVGYAHSCTGEKAHLTMSHSAQAHWADCYREVTQEHSGILGAVTSRGEAQTLRLAMTFALFDGADRVELKHVEAALAFWRYAFDSAAYIFGGAELDPVAQKILEALAIGPKAQNEIVDLFGRNLPKARIEPVLRDLQDRGRITLTKQETGGRPRKVWEAA